MYLLMWVQVQFLEPASEDSQWLETPDLGAPRSSGLFKFLHTHCIYSHEHTHICIHRNNKIMNIQDLI